MWRPIIPQNLPILTVDYHFDCLDDIFYMEFRTELLGGSLKSDEEREDDIK